MHRCYHDILERIAAPPDWFDEHAVPRWGEFTPYMAANIYAHEVVLLRVTCQACERSFDVCMSAHPLGIDGVRDLEALVRKHDIFYGDPPNVECCAAGPTMNSIPVQVLQFWRRNISKESGLKWSRVPELEIAIHPTWNERVEDSP